MFKIIVGLSVFFFIVVKNFNKLNHLKSSSLELVKITEIEYEMNVDTLPVHYFIELDKLEVTNRMACLKKGDWKACMYLCDQTLAENSKENYSDLYKCYEYYKVPKSAFGLKKC